jgi:hypothetical protein
MSEETYDQHGAEPARKMRSFSPETRSTTYAEAEDIYLRHGGKERPYAKRIRVCLGNIRLDQFTSELLDHFVPVLFPHLAMSTVDREYYSYVAAILHFAASLKLCKYVRIRRPHLTKDGEVQWHFPAESVSFAEACASHFRPLFILMTHAPIDAAEAVYLDWKQVRRDCGEINLPCREDTDEGERTLRLHARAARALQALPHRQGPVFLTPEGVAYKRTGRPASAFKSALTGAAQEAAIKFTYRTIRSTYCIWRLAVDRKADLLSEFGRSDERSIRRFKRVAEADLAVLRTALREQGWDREFARSPIVLP